MPSELMDFMTRITKAIENGATVLGLDGWLDEESDFLGELGHIQKQVTTLVVEATRRGKPLRSSYAIHSQGVRTTVVAQRVQLSYEKFTLSKQDEQFTALIDRLSTALEQYFAFENPQDLFLNEVWLYDSMSPYRDVFTPRPRFSIERALSAPHDYLNCKCCNPSVEGLSSTQPATAILYQLYLETGSLINVFDLWSAFLDIVSGNDGESCDERTALILFYRALADLKSLGMVKQSKKKVDHLAKSAWRGL
jgi:origin recognition complex subunit 3